MCFRILLLVLCFLLPSNVPLLKFLSTFSFFLQIWEEIFPHLGYRAPHWEIGELWIGGGKKRKRGAKGFGFFLLVPLFPRLVSFFSVPTSPAFSLACVKSIQHQGKKKEYGGEKKWRREKINVLGTNVLDFTFHSSVSTFRTFFLSLSFLPALLVTLPLAERLRSALASIPFSRYIVQHELA